MWKSSLNINGFQCAQHMCTLSVCAKCITHVITLLHVLRAFSRKMNEKKTKSWIMYINMGKLNRFLANFSVGSVRLFRIRSTFARTGSLP
jgi:hypothetical protein